MEPDQRDIIGFSIADPIEKDRWKGLVSDVERFLEEHGLTEEVLFHGTSARRADAILEDGLAPTDLDLAVIEDEDLGGSFWGTVRSAAAYAEDTAKERDACSPVLIMACVSDLERWAELRPDLATLDFPLKGLTRLDEDGVMDRWVAGYAGFSWQDGLRDLRAVIAIHDYPVPECYMIRIDRFEDFLQAIDARFPIRGSGIDAS